MNSQNSSIFYQDCIQKLSPVYGAGEANAMTRLLFEDIFDWKKGQKDKVLTDKQITQYQQLLQRLLKGEPVQYITGIADFFGLQLQVNPSVLIPRPETEELVEWVLETADERGLKNQPLKVLDIGTGSGCIPLALKANRPNWELTGWDVSKEALKTANQNSEQLKLAVNFAEVDMLKTETWSEQKWDIIISNPPYIPFQEEKVMPDSVLDYEPHLALFVANENPLIFYKKIAQFATKTLTPKGYLFFESNEYNSKELTVLLDTFPFRNTELKKDLQGKDRMWKGEIGAS